MHEKPPFLHRTRDNGGRDSLWVLPRRDDQIPEESGPGTREGFLEKAVLSRM